MKIRLLIAWNLFSKGHIIPDAPAALAEVLVRSCIAEYVTDAPRRTLSLKRARQQA